MYVDHYNLKMKGTDTLLLRSFAIAVDALAWMLASTIGSGIAHRAQAAPRHQLTAIDAVRQEPNVHVAGPCPMAPTCPADTEPNRPVRSACGEPFAPPRPRQYGPAAHWGVAKW